LYLLKKGLEVTVITNNRDVLGYCQSKKIKTIYCDLTRIKLTNIFALKKEVRSILKIIPKNSNIYFLFRSYDTTGFYLIKELGKNNKLFFKNINPNLEDLYPQKRYINYFCVKYYYKLLLLIALKVFADLDLTLKYIDSNWVLFLSTKFLRRNNVHNLNLKGTYAELKAEVIKVFYEKTQPKCKTLILKDDFRLDSIINEKYFIDIYSYLAHKQGLDIMMNSHPWPISLNNSKTSFFKECPSQIPCELLFPNVKSHVVSTCSSALITASFFKNLKAIALLELVVWKNKETKRRMKKWLTQSSDGRIVFPKTLDELIELLKSK